MKGIGKYMKHVGYADVAMYFYLDDGKNLTDEIGTKLVMGEPYCKHIY